MATNNIVLVLYDYSQPDWKDISQRLIDFTQWNLEGSGLPVVVTSNIDQTLRELCDTHDWAIVLAAGTKIFAPQILQQTVEHCVKENSPLVAHLLLKNNYVHFHPQFFCLDLRVFKNFDNSLLANPGFNTMVSVPIQWSDDHVHDDYTPWWVSPKANSNGSKLVRTGPVEFGQRFIAYLTGAGHRIVNIPHEIRRHKIYCYAEDSHDELRQFMHDLEYEPSQPYGVGQFIKHLRPSFQLSHFYPINSEQVRAISDQPGSIKTFAGVCGGIKPAIIVTQPEFDPDCRVILFDISEIAINWQKYLRQHWDGNLDRFKKLCADFIDQNPTIIDRVNPLRDLDQQINWVLNGQCTRAQFQQRWQHWLTLDVEYVQCDLLQTQAQQDLLQRINSTEGCSYIWTSNLFRMEWQFFFHGESWTVQARESWIALVKQHKTNQVILENEELFYVC